MGPFILGILVGWLAEWLFFTFWVKGGSKSESSDCSELLAQLSAKNKEIDALKASSVVDTTTTTSKAEAVASTAASSVKAKKAAPSTTTAPKKAKPKTSAKPAAKKAAVKKTPANKATAKKTAEKVATTAKKPAAKKAATSKKAAPKKTVAKKEPAKKAATAVKKAPAKKISVKKTAGDDLTKLSGIGPSMAATMGELGITSYKALAAMDDDILRDMLEASGARLNNNKDAMDSWNEQATLADNGDFAGLKKLQEELKG